MAIANLAPADADLVTAKEAVGMFSDTPLEPSESTIKRWIKRYQLKTEKIGRADHVSYSDLLEVHREEIRRQAGHA